MKIWIIGGASGIGLELVVNWVSKGYQILVSSRRATQSLKLLDLKNKYPNNISLLDLDVKTDFLDKTEKAWDVYGGLDLCFYNAGAYEMMPMHAWNIKYFDQMMHVNYFGAVKFIHYITPYFEKQGAGRIILNASMASYIGLPYGGGYSAPKAALINLAESIYPELLQKNIHLQIINHGFVKTRLTEKNNFDMPQLMTPKEAAKNISDALESSSSFEIRFPFALGAFLRLLRMLPYGLSLAITKKMLP